MEIVSTGPLPVVSILWRPAPHSLALMVACRATFQLAPGECPLAAEQDPLNEVDAHWNDDPSRSLSAPSDLAPFKARVDVMLVGNAYTPGGEPARSLVARLKVGEVDKSIELFGAYGAMSLPTPTPTRREVDRRGFGPIAPSWPARRELLGRHAATWPGARWMDAPLPADFDPAYFNAAPRDQQLAVLRDDEPLLLENLHPDHPRLVTSLPSVRPRAQIERRGAQEDVVMRADTLWIDTVRRICAVTWRGRVSLDHPSDPGRVVVSMISSRQPAPQLGPRPVGTQVEPQRQKPTAFTMPFVGGASEGGAAPLPFVSAPSASSPLAALAALPATRAPDVAPPPFAAPSMGAAPPPFVAPPRASSPALPASPAMPALYAPAMDATPWAPSPAPDGGRRLEPSSVSVSPSLSTDAASVPYAASGGVLAASDAARAADPPRGTEPEEPQGFVAEARPKATSREIIKVVWFDPAALPRIRKQLAWRGILADLDMTLIDEAEADVASGPLPPDAKDRRTVLEVLLQGEAIGADGVKQVVEEAIREDGGFEPPFALVAAELEMPFDEIETLKATAAAVRPLASTDKRLKEALDAVDPLLASAWPSGSESLAESLTTTLREAFAQSKRPVAPDYLSTHADRMLLAQRAYQRRSLFDKKWIRSVMRGAAGAIPAYLPEDLKDGLPMFRKFRVRMLAELDMREDEGEQSPWVVRVVALGRVITRGG